MRLETDRIRSAASPGHDLLTALRTALPEVKTCLDELHDKAPGARGELILRASIEDAGGVGRVTEIAVSPKTGEPRAEPDVKPGVDDAGGARDGDVTAIAQWLEACLTRTLAAAVFQPPASGRVTFTQPIAMEPPPSP